MQVFLHLILFVSFHVILSYQQRLFQQYPRRTDSVSSNNNNKHGPTRILLDVQIKDQECALPYWLHSLQNLHCPGSCDIRLYSLDNSLLVNEAAHYIRRNFPQFTNVQSVTECSPPDTTVDYIFHFTSDHYILKNDTISTLIAKKKLFVAPLLNIVGESKLSEVSTASTFATYGLTESIESVLSRNILGCFSANITNLPVLVNVQSWRKLISDRIPSCGGLWLYQANEILRRERLESYVCNREFYGYIPDYNIFIPQYEAYKRSDLERELRCEATEYMLLEHQLQGPNKTYLQPLGKVGDFYRGGAKRLFTLDEIDKVYVINLRRRKDRLDRTLGALDVLNISAQIVEAYDGSQMTLDDLKQMNIKMVEPYVDPYNKRPINLGEVACSLSHHWVWNDANVHKYKQIIVLEDDARFGLLFKYKLNTTLESLKRQNIDWDMIYLGRKIMNIDEHFVPTIATLVRPNYSHWTVAYMLSQSGISKLIKQNFKRRMLPVDEFLPLMYDQQPMEYLKDYFPDREILNTFAFQPSIIQPTHYYGEPSYISDTENTTVVL